jgi:CBS domain-containing protein
VLDPSAPKAGARIDQIAGIISERDIVRALIAAHSTGDVLDMAAASVMTEIRATIGLSASVRDAAILMTDRRVRHLPVIEDDVLVGLVSIGDVVKARLEQQETEVESLRAYVVGAG